MALHIEEPSLDPTDIVDLVVHSEIDEDGPHRSMTLYWSATAQDESP